MGKNNRRSRRIRFRFIRREFRLRYYLLSILDVQRSGGCTYAYLRTRFDRSSELL